MICQEVGSLGSVELPTTTSTKSVIFYDKYDNNWLDMSKICSKCGLEKSLSEFGTSCATKKDGHNSWCKQCVRNSSKIFSESPSGIYSAIKGRQRYYEKTNPEKAKPVTISRKNFIDWYDNEPRVCAYCNLLEEEIEYMDDAYNKQSERLSVDCMTNDVGYAKDNLVLACRQCNSLKSDLLNYDEMREFAQKFIKPKHQKILNQPSVKKEDVK